MFEITNNLFCLKKKSVVINTILIKKVKTLITIVCNTVIIININFISTKNIVKSSQQIEREIVLWNKKK
jgi:hypothetical protein